MAWPTAAFLCGDRCCLGTGSATFLQLPQPWPRPCAAGPAGPHRHLNLTPQAPRQPTHLSHTACVSVVSRPWARSWREMALTWPPPENTGGDSSTPRAHRPSGCALLLGSALNALCHPTSMYCPSHTHSSATHGPSVSPPLLRQGPLPGMPFLSKEIPPSFRPSANSTSPRRLLNKHESLSPSSGISGCLCDEGLSSPQGCELPTGRAWITSEIPGPGMQPSG